MQLHDERDPREHDEDTSVLDGPDEDTVVCVYCSRRFHDETHEALYCSLECCIDAEAEGE